jgi:hypothetical protein
MLSGSRNVSSFSAPRNGRSLVSKWVVLGSLEGISGRLFESGRGCSARRCWCIALLGRCWKQSVESHKLRTTLK